MNLRLKVANLAVLALITLATGCSTGEQAHSNLRASSPGVELAGADRHLDTHPLLDRWQRSLNGRLQSTVDLWITAERVLRIAYTRLQELEPVPLTLVLGNQRNPDDSMTLFPASDIQANPLESALVLDRLLAIPNQAELKQPQISDIPARSVFVGLGGGSEGAEIPGTGVGYEYISDSQDPMQKVLQIFGVSFLVSVLLIPGLCSFGAQFVANPIRGSPSHGLKTYKVTIDGPDEQPLGPKWDLSGFAAVGEKVLGRGNWISKPPTRLVDWSGTSILDSN